MITERQKDYIFSLSEQRDLSSLTEEQRLWLSEDNVPNLTKEQASRVIQHLLSLPWLPKGTVGGNTNAVEVPKGYFFIVDPTDGVEKFFRVDKPDDGKWEGYTFLKVRAGDDFWSIKDKKHRDAVLDEIAKDPVAAMDLYGRKLGRCGVCNRTLTARDSRLRGIGPICAARL